MGLGAGRGGWGGGGIVVSKPDAYDGEVPDRGKGRDEG